jgi:copper chaperone NosL
MLNFKLQNTTTNWAFEMVTDYDTPEKLIYANESFVLRSKKLPSPMGAYLTSTASKEVALKLQEKFGGTIYSYAELSEKFKQLPKW